MVKSLADELSKFLILIENNAGSTRAEICEKLAIFCRGLVCGLRQAEKDAPITLDEGLADAYKADCERAEQKRRADEAQCREERRHCREMLNSVQPMNAINL